MGWSTKRAAKSSTRCLPACSPRRWPPIRPAARVCSHMLLLCRLSRATGLTAEVDNGVVTGWRELRFCRVLLGFGIEVGVDDGKFCQLLSTSVKVWSAWAIGACRTGGGGSVPLTPHLTSPLRGGRDELGWSTKRAARSFTRCPLACSPRPWPWIQPAARGCSHMLLLCRLSRAAGVDSEG